MSGTLFHGQDFEKVHYIGNDGLPHYEVSVTDGDLDGVSLSNWEAIIKFCERKEIPRSAWPEYETAFDVPLDEVRQKNARIRDLILALGEESEDEVAHHHWLVKLVGYLKRDESFFFSMD